MIVKGQVPALGMFCMDNINVLFDGMFVYSRGLFEQELCNTCKIWQGLKTLNGNGTYLTFSF